MDKYIIYTHNKCMNKAVREVLLEKKYRLGGWGDDAWVIYLEENGYFEYDHELSRSKRSHLKNYKELSFRQLCELPPVHDEVEELAEAIYNSIIKHLSESNPDFNEPDGPNRVIPKQDWCAVWERIKPKLGL
jgi:hypothetical protein